MSEREKLARANKNKEAELAKLQKKEANSN